MQTTQPVLRTLEDWIRWAATRLDVAGVFHGHGMEAALDEAAYLALHALGLPPEVPASVYATVLTDEEGQTLRALIRRRIEERLPAAYLTGEAWFCGLQFSIDERVLVPRSPIAELIEQSFSPWLAWNHEVRHILDLCTGSGCIAIACAHAFPEAEVDAVDISSDALAVAHRNIQRHGLIERVRAIHSDLFHALEGECYDIIVSNPPYVAEAEMAQLPREYRHEPELGLVAGDEGLEFVLRILREAPRHLRAGGLLVVEVGASRAALERRLPTVPFNWPDFERGGEGVFLLTAEELETHRQAFGLPGRG
ncbi:MAG: 50S ribosomal protein L3 N(5)-glutamine methyltransferase [Gammaproteobacteria bacterium]